MKNKNPLSRTGKSLAWIFVLSISVTTVLSFNRPLNYFGVAQKTKKVFGKIYTLAIGVDKYPLGLALRGCVNDAEHLTQKIKSEYDDSLHNNFEYRFTGITQIILRNEEVTNASIKQAIDSIAKLAKPDDIFLFYFSGYSSEDSLTGTQLNLIPDPKHSSQQKINSLPGLPISVLSEWFSLIQCDRQYIVSDAGKGSEFKNSLISNLFEKNVFVGKGKNQNRVIVTTNGIGVESLYEGYGHGGLLSHYLFNVDNLIGKLANLENGGDYLEKALMKTEMENPSEYQVFADKVYSRVYQEKDFIPILASLKTDNSRGPTKPNSPPANSAPHSKGKNIAIIIGTNNYSNNTDWRQLKNPVSDCNAVGKLLNDKYDFDVRYLLNQPQDSILSAIVNLKYSLDSSDNIVVFFAGHGYYDEQFSQGYIVTTDSRPLAKDFSRSSYISWPNITSMIDALPAKNIFLISDICFGGRFDFYSKSIAPQDYKKQLSDITPTEFAERKSKHISRIFLASGSKEVPDYWSNSTDHSPFASKLIYGLNQEKSFTTPGQLFSYMAMNVTEPVLKYFGRHEAEGEFVLLEKTK